MGKTWCFEGYILCVTGVFEKGRVCNVKKQIRKTGHKSVRMVVQKVCWFGFI